MRMRSVCILATTILAAACVLAQDENRGPRPGGARHPRGEHPMMGRPMMMPPSGPWVAQLLCNSENLDKIGVTDEALRGKLTLELQPIKDKGNALEKQIREISREQAQLMRELFADKAKDAKPVLDKIDEVAKLRAEQGRLAVKAILVARDNLSPEQLEKAQALIREGGRQRGWMRREGGDGPRGAHGEGRGRRHPEGKKGKGPRSAPKE